MTTPKGPDTVSQFDIHLDLSTEQHEQLRTGKIALVLQDTKTGDQVRVGKGPMSQAITWRAAFAFVTLFCGLAANIFLLAVKTTEITNAIEKIDPLTKDVVTALSVLAQHGEEFGAIRQDMTTILTLYERLSMEIDDKTRDRYTDGDAASAQVNHREYHRLEREAYDARFDALRLHLEHNENP